MKISVTGESSKRGPSALIENTKSAWLRRSIAAIRQGEPHPHVMMKYRPGENWIGRGTSWPNGFGSKAGARGSVAQDLRNLAIFAESLGDGRKRTRHPVGFFLGNPGQTARHRHYGLAENAGDGRQPFL